MLVVHAHTPTEPDFGSGNESPVRVQDDSADCNPAEVDNQVESVEVVMVIDHQDN